MPGIYGLVLSFFMQRDVKEISVTVIFTPVSYLIYAEKRAAVVYASVN